MLNAATQWTSRPHPKFTKIGHVSAVLTIFISIIWLSITPGGPFHGLWSQYQRDQRDLAYLKETYQTRSASSAALGNYDIVTMDGGKHWWDATVTFENGERNVFINGPANPAIVTHEKARQAYNKYVLDHGIPTTFDAEYVRLLSDYLSGLGITIEYKTPQPSSP